MEKLCIILKVAVSFIFYFFPVLLKYLGAVATGRGGAFNEFSDRVRAAGWVISFVFLRTTGRAGLVRLSLCFLYSLPRFWFILLSLILRLEVAHRLVTKIKMVNSHVYCCVCELVSHTNLCKCKLNMYIFKYNAF